MGEIIRFPIDKSTWKPFTQPQDITKHGVYLGTSGYSFKDWNNLFYPPKIPKRNLPTLSTQERANQDNFTYYQNYFKFIEINYTYYQEPKLQTFIDFCRKAKETTQFSIKVHNQISHTKQWDINEGKRKMAQHIEAVSPLVESGRFFSFLIQLEDKLRQNHNVLQYLIEVSSMAINKGLDVHIEFRNISWHRELVLQKLKDFGVGICNTEIPMVAHAFPLKSYATSPKGYIRYSGLNLKNWVQPKGNFSYKEKEILRNARYNYLYSEEEIKARTKGQINLFSKVNSMAIAYNNHFNASAVHNALKNINLLKEYFDTIKNRSEGEIQTSG